MKTPIEDPLEITLPADVSAAGRSILVAPNKLSTFRLMHDPHDPNRNPWFNQGAGMPRVTDGNEVMHLIRGEETYADMVQQIRWATQPDPERRGPTFVYIAGWDLSPGAYNKMQLKAGDSGSTLATTLQKASDARVEVRAMPWCNPAKTPFTVPWTRYTVEAINKLPTGRGIVDWKTAIWFIPPPPVHNYIFHVGAHHQKVVIIRGSGPITAYLGGIDIDLTRLDQHPQNAPDSPQYAWHDVHCRIIGPAADDVLDTFSQRWDDYLGFPSGDVNYDTVQPAFTSVADKSVRNRLSGAKMRSQKVDGKPYRQSVQIGRTFHSQLYDNVPPGNRSGEKTLRAMVKHAISRAERFIYMEDQYLVSMEISDALKQVIAKPSFRWLIILIPDDNSVNSEIGGQGSHRRAQFIMNLRNAPGGEKVKVFTYPTRYVHSKSYIIDDKFAIIGSANCNRRGMQHDSEISAGIFDASNDASEALHFARRLRMRLWAAHLNLSAKKNDPNKPADPQEDYAEFADGIASAVHWFKRTPSARVADYQVNDDVALAKKFLQTTKDEYITELKTQLAKTGAPPPIVAAAVQELDSRLTKILSDPRAVDILWDQVIDPGDP